ncbi:MAG: diguanylate cyclase/phosphodiesterase [Phycisphaerales bacterium]|nr:diguanylate cyclase/phosphodiesterase [Phycisphaerales bacterium]
MTPHDARRAAEVSADRLHVLSARCDRTFAILMVIQWLGAIAITLWLSPRTWTGSSSTIHPHVYAAVFLGGLISSVPIYMAWKLPGRSSTRQVVAVAQMLWSALLIHLTGGRIETHFHVFGSLAFLAWYRDRRVLLTATLVTVFDHALRGAFWPQSVYGVLAASGWRTLEHFAWVSFEDAFLFVAISRSLRELRENSLMQAQIEVTANKLAEHRSAVFLERVGQVAGVGGWRLELATQELHWTAQTCRIHGLPPGHVPTLEEAINYYAPDARPIIASAVREGMELGKPWDLELELVTADGRPVHVRAVGEVEYEGGKPVRLLGAFQDITLRKNMEADLRTAAQKDRLTGLPNRALLLDRLQLAIARYKRSKESRYAVLFLDFDRFKMVNDSLGHEVGDQLLVEIAARLKSATRMVDSVSRESDKATASRLGGDEFVILLDGLRAVEDAAQVAGRILQALGEPYKLGGHEIVSTASIGIVTSDYGYDRAEDVLRDADTAMYRAKSEGKDRFVIFDETMHAAALERLRIESDLRKAMDRKELLLHYQPVISLQTAEIEGFEALIRWNRNGRLVSPGEFIPIAEDTGLIIPIGRWVVDESIRQLAHWRAKDPRFANLSVAINLSRRQLGDTDLVSHIKTSLATHRVPAGLVKLEVTESMVMQNGEKVLQLMHTFRSLGLKMSMDDFGTGHSSLACLHQFPFDVLKIDRSFMVNLTGRRETAAVILAVLHLAHNLGMTIIAEGLESTDQVAFLQAGDCDFGQGYVFARPLTPADAEAFLAKHPPGSGTSTDLRAA